MTVAVMSVYGFICWPQIYGGPSRITVGTEASDASKLTQNNYASDAAAYRNSGGASSPGTRT